MVFGDIALNWMVDETGMNRCHGMLSPPRTPSGDIARMRLTAQPGTPEYEAQVRNCINQRIAVWKATKKGERAFNGQLGCCLRDYFNEPLTASNLLKVQKQVEWELGQILPEMNVRDVKVRTDARNQVTIESIIGNFEVEFATNPEELDRLHTDLQRAMGDLRIGVFR